MSKISYSFLWRKKIVEDELLPSTTKLVAMVLHFHMDNHTGECFPSEATIAREASLSERCVVNHIKKLRKLNYISIKKVKGGLGWNRNFYKGLYFKDHDLDDEIQFEDSESENKGPAYECKSSVNDIHINSSINSSIDNSKKNTLKYLEIFIDLFPLDHQEDSYSSLHEGWLNFGFEDIGDEIIQGLLFWIDNRYFEYCYKMSEKRFLMEERWRQIDRPLDDD